MIGAQIAKLRNRFGWTQVQLARELHVDLKTVRKWENGDSDPSAKNILNLTEIFGVSADFLLGKDNQTAIYIGSLCEEDQRKISAMVQVFINLST